MKQVAEDATRLFIDRDEVLIKGLIVAGPGTIKDELIQSGLIDPRISTRIIAVEDIGSELSIGFYEACNRASSKIQNVRLEEERLMISKLMQEMNQATGLYAVGLADTIYALQNGAIKTLLIDAENKLKTVRITSPVDKKKRPAPISVPSAEEKKEPSELIGDLSRGVLHARSEEEALECVRALEKKKSLGEAVEVVPFVEWILQEAETFSIRVELVTSSSPEAMLFRTGLGGISALLRYAINFEELHQDYGDLEIDSDEDDASPM